MNVKYSELEQIYSSLNVVVDNLVDSATAIKKMVNNLDNHDHWDGEGYDVYNKKLNDLTTNFKSYCDRIYVLNNNIKVSISKYKEIDKKVMNSLGGF